MPFFSQASERLIVQGCLKNERYYQKMLFDRYKDAMYTVVFRMLRNEAQACDAVQEGLYRFSPVLQHTGFSLH